MVEVMRRVDALPQRQLGWWRHWPSGRALSVPMAVGALLLAFVLAGAVGLATGLIPQPPTLLPGPSPSMPQETVDPRPTVESPRPTPIPVGLGGIAVQGDGCAILGIDPDTGAIGRLSGGFPHCFPTANTMDLAWSPDGRTLAIAYTFSCGGCTSDVAHAAIDNKVDGLWLLHADSGEFEQIERCSHCVTGTLTGRPPAIASRTS